MAGLVGSSNNPVSGVTIATILFFLAADAVAGRKGGRQCARAAVIMIGAVVCCAAAIGGDNMQDLKAGRIVGSTPLQATDHAGGGRRFGHLSAGADTERAAHRVRHRTCDCRAAPIRCRRPRPR